MSPRKRLLLPDAEGGAEALHFCELVLEVPPLPAADVALRLGCCRRPREPQGTPAPGSLQPARCLAAAPPGEISTAGSCYGPKKAEAGQELAAYYNHSNAGVLCV